MSRIADVTILKDTPIKPSPEGGTTIGTIYPWTGVIQVLVDDPESPHDGMVLLTGPVPALIKPDGTYKETGKKGWAEFSGHLQEVSPQEHEYHMFTDAITGAVKRCIMVR